MAASASLTADDFKRLPAEATEHHGLVEGGLVDVSGAAVEAYYTAAAAC